MWTSDSYVSPPGPCAETDPLTAVSNHNPGSASKEREPIRRCTDLRYTKAGCPGGIVDAQSSTSWGSSTISLDLTELLEANGLRASEAIDQALGVHGLRESHTKLGSGAGSRTPNLAVGRSLDPDQKWQPEF